LSLVVNEAMKYVLSSQPAYFADYIASSVLMALSQYSVYNLLYSVHKIITFCVDFVRCGACITM